MSSNANFQEHVKEYVKVQERRTTPIPLGVPRKETTNTLNKLRAAYLK